MKTPISLPKLLVMLLLIVGSMFVWARPSLAFDWRGGDSIVLSQDQESDGSLYAFGQTITIDGKVNGDLVCAGQEVVVTGPVNGDVLCAAQNIRLEGQVSGDVRVAAQTLSLTDTIGGNVHLAAQSFEFGPDAIVGRELALAVQTARLDGEVISDVNGFVQTAQLNGKFGGDVQLTADELTLAENASIRDNLVYVAPQPAAVTPDQVGGEISYKELEIADEAEQPPMLMQWLTDRAWAIASYLLLGLAMVYFWPKLIDKMVASGKSSTGMSLVVGFLALIAWPILSIALMITVIGVPMAFILLLWGFLVLIVARLVPAIWLGSYLAGSFQKKPSRWAAAWLGIPLAWLMFGLPHVGFWISALAAIWGVGAILLSVKQVSQKGK